MLKLTRWCIGHRRTVIISWIGVAVITTALATAAGRNWATDYSLPGTQSQQVVDLLKSQFKAQSGDVDQVVFHTSQGTIDSPAVHSAMTALLQKVRNDRHVVTVVSPYSAQGAVEVSKDRRTAFATVNYDKRANLLANNTGQPVLNQVKAVHVPGLQVAAGGQVIEAAEGFNIGPATEVGVIAALLILVFTFGSFVAASMPLVTAGFGLITGVAVIGLGTHVTSMSNISPQLALMIGLGVGIDYALFIVTRFRENYAKLGDVEGSVVEAMDTAGRAVLLAGATVVIALLGMFATGVSFMYGLSIASVATVLLVMVASLTVLPAFLSRYGHKIVPQPGEAKRGLLRRSKRPAQPAVVTPAAITSPAQTAEHSRWRDWSRLVQAHPVPLTVISLAVIAALLIPVFGLRLESSDAGNDPSNTTSRHAYDLLAQGFGAGFNGPLTIAVHGAQAGQAASALPAVRSALSSTPDLVAVTAPRLAPSGTVAVIDAFPRSSPQAEATSTLVNHLRNDVFPSLAKRTGTTILVGGFTAGSIDFSHVLASKLPLFIGLVVVLSALLLFVMFRSIVVPIQAAIMNLLSIGGALGITVAVFQDGFLGSVFGVEKAPIEPWIPVIMFAVVFGLSMDYEVFLISRIREEWMRRRDPSEAVADGIAFTGRVITAAAAIMIVVFLSFMLGNERPIREFGFGLAAAVLLDALVIRCVLLPAVLELLGPATWRIPGWLDNLLPHINIEGSTAREQADQNGAHPGVPTEREPAIFG